MLIAFIQSLFGGWAYKRKGRRINRVERKCFIWSIFGFGNFLTTNAHYYVRKPKIGNLLGIKNCV